MLQMWHSHIRQREQRRLKPMWGAPEGFPTGGVGCRPPRLLGIRRGLVLLEVALDDVRVEPALRLRTSLRDQQNVSSAQAH